MYGKIFCLHRFIRWSICWIVMYIISAQSIIAYAQNISPKLQFKYIKNEDGLSNSTIEAIFQDHRGFMWFGTRDGLNRYDGAQILVYKFDAKAPHSISDNYITCLYEDQQHTLWVGTLNGLNKFDPILNRFIAYKHDPSNSQSLSHNHITGIYEDKPGQLWVSTLGGGINLFNPQQGTFSALRKPQGLSSDEVLCFFEDPQHNFWIGTSHGLQLLDRERKKLTLIPMPGDSKGGPYSSISAIKVDKLGQLLLGTSDNGLIVYQPHRRSF